MSYPPLSSLPHRPPFLFLDEVLELSSRRVLARREVREDEPHFQGHYPGRPIMPGVLLCEAALQAGCYLLLAQGGGAFPEGDPVVTRIYEARFKRQVRPGDVLDIEVLHEESKLGAHFMKGTLRVKQKTVAMLSFAVMQSAEEP